MNDKTQRAQRGRADLPPQDARRSAISSSFERFERRQNELWRLTFLILFLLGLAYAWTSWGSMRSQAVRFEALPIGLVVLVALFGAYMWKKTREISELRGLLRGLEERDMPRFLERRQWTGILQVQLKNQKSPFYFDCVAHAMLRDDNVHGITVLARDVSALRRNETRFTELFETLQEGIYMATPDGRIL